jgi:hypothetical protein
MEKRERLNELRKGKLPLEFINKYKGISRIILKAIDSGIYNRPNASELVEAIEDEIFSLENDYVIIPTYRKCKSDVIVDEFVLIENENLDLSYLSGYTMATSVDCKYNYVHKISPYILDCYDSIMTMRNK